MARYDTDRPDNQRRGRRSRDPEIDAERGAQGRTNPEPAEDRPPVRRPPRRVRRRFSIPITVIAVIGIAYLVYWYTVLRGHVSTDDAFVDAHDFTISAKMLGRIDSLMASDGDTVSAGELLVVLDARELQAQETRASADVEVARRSVTLEQAGVALAEEDFQRAQTQYSRAIIPKAQFDHAQKSLEMARAKLAMAKAQLATAEAGLAVIRSQLEQTRIPAPTWGVVARKWVVPGDVVQPGAPILTLYDLRDVWITANLEETKLRALRLGDPAEVKLDAYPQIFRGEVSLIGAAAASQFSLIPPNNASGNFTKVTQRIPIRVRLDHPGHPAQEQPPGLLPGMSATVRIRVGGRP